MRKSFGQLPIGPSGEMGKLTLIRIGEEAEINLFELDGNTEAEHQIPMFGRGRLDHVGLNAASIEAFEEIRRRLIAVGRPTSSSPTLVPGTPCSSGIRTGSKA